MRNTIVCTVQVIKDRTVHVARMEDGRSGSKILTGTTTGKRPLGRPRRRWEDTKVNKMDLKYEELG